jgi:rare lipoprotein A
MNMSDTSAGENSGFTKVTVSKDAQPSFSNVNFDDIGTMTASWYGPRFHGKTTANGESFNQMALTAAHKTLPFGTVIKVTNFKTGKSVLVRINDRGPFVDGRDLDLSRGTALALGMTSRGVIKVKVQQLTFENSELPISTLN